MKIALMAIGGILVAMGLLDLVGSYTGFDLWGSMGIQLPDLLWRYSSFIEIIAGYFLFKTGKAQGVTKAEA
jgi:uncharacterized membrane protein YphA (DoxX/SURF4 family)